MFEGEQRSEEPIDLLYGFVWKFYVFLSLSLCKFFS